MASIQVKFRPSATTGNDEGTIYYQIIHARKVRQLISGHKITHSKWEAYGTIAGDRNGDTHSIHENIRRDIERLKKIVIRLDCSGLPYTADDIIDEFNRYTQEYTLFNFMGNIISRLLQNDKIRTAETYKATLNSFRKFRHGNDIILDCLDSETMEAYETWHRMRGITPNTISFYIRIIRAVYNRAVEQNIIENRNPFRHVYTGIDKTVKRALPLSMIRKIKALDLSDNKPLDLARDIFMLSFYLRGMSFIDMSYLKKTDLQNGYITYRRRKTGQRLIIQWTKEMQMILNKYPENESCYLLPIIKKTGINERCSYRNMSYRINYNLKKIAQMIGVQSSLTLYVARHSWASAAKTKGIPINVISECMGHDSETTTQIYLLSLSTSVTDRANALIIKSL